MTNVISFDDEKAKKVLKLAEPHFKALRENNDHLLLHYWEMGLALNQDQEYCGGHGPLPEWASRIDRSEHDFYYMGVFATSFTWEQVEALTQLSYLVDWRDIVDYLFHKVSPQEILDAARECANGREFIGRLVMMRPEAEYSLDVLDLLDAAEPKVNKYDLLGRLVQLRREPFQYDDLDYLT